MGSCVLKECGFQLNTEQQKKERLFKDRMRSEFFMRMADDFETVRGKSSRTKGANPHSPLPSEDEGGLPIPKKTREVLDNANTKENRPLETSRFGIGPIEKTPEPAITSPIFSKDASRDPPPHQENGPTGRNSSGKPRALRQRPLNQSRDLRKSGTSGDYNTGFHNKLFNQDLSSEDAGNDDFEQIFRDEDSDDEGYLEKLFPGSVRRRKE